MAKRVALIPEELVSTYHLQKPEIRIEEEIDKLLEKSNLPNDIKVKLLGQLVTRYHKTVHAPTEPVRVIVENESEMSQENNKKEPVKDHDSIYNQHEDTIVKDIILSTPHKFKQFIPHIIEKLKTRQYAWNQWGEFVQDNKTFEGSNVVDFFSYLTRNIRTQDEPKHFNYFLKAIKEVKIPHIWIGNKKVLNELRQRQPHFTKSEGDSEDDESKVFYRSRIRSDQNPYIPRTQVRERSRSTPRSNTRWLEY